LTGAFITCVILMVLLFPWQTFMNYSGVGGATFRLPGVLMTWSELVNEAHFGESENEEVDRQILKWSRYVAFPLAAIILLLVVQTKSKRGLRLALGEAEVDTDLGAEQA